MIRTPFVDDWSFRPVQDFFSELRGAHEPWTPVTLPHDALLTRPRTPPTGTAPGAMVRDGSAKAYFPDLVVEYRRTFVPPPGSADRRMVLEFEGVYRHARVHVNGAVVATCADGYSTFFAEIGPWLRHDGTPEEITVVARSFDDSRWYSGCGIHRDVWLHTGPQVGLGPQALTVTCPQVDADLAVVEVAARVDAGPRVVTRRCEITLVDADGTVVATDHQPVTVVPGGPTTVRQRFTLEHPRLWDLDRPHLYTCRVRLLDADGTETDCAETRTGVRRLTLDHRHGLALNGRPLKLRGACLHHDNGPIGAASPASAERRRASVMKAAGFTALRMSHHPMSPALLEACDEVGLLVVDEAFDTWATHKRAHDQSLEFAGTWEGHLEAMVAKDRNHPCVVMYSIGNEIPENGSPAGAAQGRRMAELLRRLDPTRFVTNGVNGPLSVTDALAGHQAADEGAGINGIAAADAAAWDRIGASELVTTRTEEAFALLDVAGMNYLSARYEGDAERFAHRVVVGTETYPREIDRDWALVTALPSVVGDFTWTGWDYLGEVGIGRPVYGTPGEFAAPWPHLLAGCGDVDVTGLRRPQSYYREIVYGLRAEPYPVVEHPDHHGLPFAGSPWAWRDVQASWSWAGHEGRPVLVEVYSDADEVELLQDGAAVGRAPAGPQHRFTARFDVTWRPGRLTAVAVRAGRRCERTDLVSPDPRAALRLRDEAPAAGGDPLRDRARLHFVAVELADAAGRVHTHAEPACEVQVHGPGEVLAFTGARPDETEPYPTPRARLHRGRALAVVRRTGPGPLTLQAQLPGEAPVLLHLHDPRP